MTTSCVSILFTGDMSSPFVIRDYEMLCKDYNVSLTPLPRDNGKLKRYLNNFFYIPHLFLKLKDANILFSEFASWHSAVGVLCCKILKKKSIIVVGGYDAANLPELKYGLFANPFTAIFAKITYRYGDRFLVVEKSLAADICINMNDYIKNIIYIPRGHDSQKFKYDYTELQKGTKTVLTVAKADYVNRVKLKGLDTFVTAARYFPDVQFVVIGVTGKAKDYLKEKLKYTYNNVLFIGYLPQDQLVTYFKLAKVYCQLSKREGIPNVLCEAMLCECIPVGTKVPGIMEAIGDTGYLMEYGDVDDTVRAIRMALNTPDIAGEHARRRILYKFSDEQRRSKIRKVILDLWG